MYCVVLIEVTGFAFCVEWAGGFSMVFGIRCSFFVVMGLVVRGEIWIGLYI